MAVFKSAASSCLMPSTPCKINPSVNCVLSARKPHRDATPLKRLQDWKAQQQQAEGAQAPDGEGRPREQSMYCKELLFSGVTEFCFEELRAERYRQKHGQRLPARDTSSSGQSAAAEASVDTESCGAGPSSSGSSHST